MIGTRVGGGGGPRAGGGSHRTSNNACGVGLSPDACRHIPQGGDLPASRSSAKEDTQLGIHGQELQPELWLMSSDICIDYNSSLASLFC